MLSPRLTNCPECANIPSLIKKIDCKLAELGNNLYNNISYMLNKSVPSNDILQLIGYRRILMYKYYNPNYVHTYSVQMIASRVIRLTSGCVSKCNEPERCLEEPCDITIVQNPTTTTTTSITPSTSTTTTSTTIIPTTTTSTSSSTSTTTSSSTSTTTSTSSSTTTTTTTNTYLCGFMDVIIGDQVWTACNLNVDTYRNGDPIYQATNASEWNELTTGAWCYYNFDPVNGAIYGKLYNWYAVTDPRGLAPIGYHIPTLAEFATLSSFLGVSAGGKLKETGTFHWTSPNTGATNETLFTGLPGGYASYSGSFIGSINNYGYFWAVEEYSSILGNYYRLDYNANTFNLNGIRKDSGISVRLIKDSNVTTTTTTLAPTGINTIYTTFDAL
jgi:uncharacterized protein (TIGR02145 family)